MNIKWDGQGLPPVGTVCEGFTQDSARQWRWLEVEMLKHNNLKSGECAVHAVHHGVLRWCSEFRPIKSDKEKWIDKSLGSLGHYFDAGDYQRRLFSHIYDALISGELPIPEVKHDKSN